MLLTKLTVLAEDSPVATAEQIESATADELISLIDREFADS
jgi:hypothetical protein